MQAIYCLHKIVVNADSYRIIVSGIDRVVERSAKLKKRKVLFRSICMNCNSVHMNCGLGN